MPRCFFDLADGTREEDTASTELPGHAEAKVEAIRFLGEVLKQEPNRLVDGRLRVEVSNGARIRCWTIAVTVEVP